MSPFTHFLASLRLIPVITLDQPDFAHALADALIAGGLPCAEITFRTQAAAECIRRLSVRGDLLLGAGTVLDVEHAERALDAGPADRRRVRVALCRVIAMYLFEGGVVI